MNRPPALLTGRRVLTPALKLRVMQDYDTLKRMDYRCEDVIREYLNLYCPLMDMITYGYVTEISHDALEQMDIETFRADAEHLLEKEQPEMHRDGYRVEWSTESNLDALVAMYDRTDARWDAQIRYQAHTEA